MNKGLALLVLPLALACCYKKESKQADPAPDKAATRGEQMPPAGAPSPALEAARAAIAQKRCPVMGGLIDPEVHTDLEGRRIYFCCPSCIENFKKDPEKYLKIVDAALQQK